MIFFHDVLSDLTRVIFSDESKAQKRPQRLAAIKKSLHAVHDQLWYNKQLVDEASKTGLPDYFGNIFDLLYGYGKRMSTVNDADRILIELSVDILGDLCNLLTVFVKHKDKVAKYLPKLHEFQAKYANYTPFISARDDSDAYYFHALRKEIHMMNMRLWRAVTILTNELSPEQMVNCFRTTFAMLTDEANDVPKLRSGDLPDLAAQVTMLQSCGHMVTDAYDNYEARLRSALKDPKVDFSHLLKFAQTHVDSVDVGIYTTMILSKVSHIQTNVEYLKTTLAATRKFQPCNEESVRLAFIASIVIHNYLIDKSQPESLFLENDVPGILVYNLKSLLENHSKAPEWCMKAFRGYLLCVNSACGEVRAAIDRRGARALVTRVRAEIAPFEPTLEKYIAKYMEPSAPPASAPLATAPPASAPVAQPIVVAIACGHCRNMLSVYYGTQYVACPYCRSTLKLF